MSDVFVNRDTELRALEQFRNAVIVGHGGMLLLHGDAGIGKTALATAFRRDTEAAAPTVRVVPTRCRAQVGQGDAFGPILSALAALSKPGRRRVGRASKVAVTLAPDLLALVPAIGPLLKVAGQAALAAIDKGNGVSDSMAPFQQSVVRSVSRTLLDAAGEKHPIIVIIDDAQQIDPSSLQVLDYVIEELPARYLGIVVAARQEELSESTELGRVVGNWMSRELVQDLLLDGLVSSSIEELAESICGKQPATGDAAHLQRMTGGSPLCLMQYFRLGRETGQWETDTRSLFRGSQDIRKAVETIVRGRLARLDDTAMRLLVIGVTEGEVFHTTIVEEIADLPREKVREKLYAASVNTRLIVLDEMSLWAQAISSDTYRFEHSLLHAALEASQSPATARERHAKIGELLAGLTLQHAGAPAGIVLDIARHYRSAGIHDKAAKLSVRAARELVANRLSFDEAKELAHAAIDDLRQIPGTANRDRGLAEAIELFLILTEINWSNAAAEKEGFGLDALAREAQEAAARVGDPRLLARSALLRGKVTLHTRGLADSLALLEYAVDLARDTDDPATLFVALAEYGRQLPKLDLPAGIRVLRDAEALFERTPLLQVSTDPVVIHARNLTEMQLGVNLFDIGDLGAAIERLTSCTARLRATRLNSELPIALNYSAQLMIACGQWDAATALLEDALSVEEQHGDSAWHAYNTALLALVKTRTANRDECRNMAEQAWRETRRTWLANLIPIVRNLYAQIVLDLAEGDPVWLADSDRLAAETIEETQSTGMVRSEIAALIIRSQVARLRCDYQAAVSFADQAVGLLDTYGTLPALRTEEMLLQAALAHRSIGDDAGTTGLVERASAEVNRKAQSLPGELRGNFLADVPINVSIAALSQAQPPDTPKTPV